MTIAEYKQLIAKQTKTSKYKNQKVYVYVDGYVGVDSPDSSHGKPAEIYDSIKEYERGAELALMARAGVIKNLRRQVVLEIQPKFHYRNEILAAINYKADYMYEANGEIVVEDVKPLDKQNGTYRVTKDFALKWKLLKAKYPDYRFEFY